MKILYIIEVFIFTTIIYFSVIMLSSYITNKHGFHGDRNSILSEMLSHSNKTSESFKTNCEFQRKKCPSYHCDCAKLCQNPTAKRVFYPDGVYCNIPAGQECKAEFGSWVFHDLQWKCAPTFPGVFDSDGSQVVGKYPYSEGTGKIVFKDPSSLNINYNDPLQFSLDCSNLTDEYGNYLINIQLSNGLSFCLKDYCLMSPSTGYKDGKCICDGVTENFVLGDLSSPCVKKGLFLNDSYTFKLKCFNENTYVKDLENFLIDCPPGSDKDYLESVGHEIEVLSNIK